MVGQKLDLLNNNLNKKDKLLAKIGEVLDKQLQLLESPDSSIDELDACMEIQGGLAEELEGLNEEADKLYMFLKEQELSSDAKYASKIADIQSLLAQLVSDFTVLQEKEQKAKEQTEAFFQKERKNFGDGRRSSKAALDYYKSMSGANVVPPQFMDQKK